MVLNRQKDAAISRLFYRIFKNARYGTLNFTEPSGKQHVFVGDKPGPLAEFNLRDWKTIRMSALRGDIGFGEAYIEGLWTTTDLGTLMEYMVYNFEPLEEVVNGHQWMQQIFRAINWLRRNTRKNSRLNIRAHYDVGNSFYKLWLDETMSYSSALYEGDATRTMAEAQRAKYRRLLSKMDRAGSILEIGCGWGGFAEEATKQGHHVTGLTLSTEQLAFAQERMRALGMAEKTDLRLEDYRDVTGTFDNIVSIEMLEAVGEQYWPIYFETLRARLKPGGKALVQTITVDDAHFEGYRSRSDFIRHYTFPGGLLPSVKRLREEITKAGLVCREVFPFGQDYARTCQEWLDRINARTDEIKALGYSEEFLRSWRFYLGCCIGAFRVGHTDVVQLEITHA